MNFTNFIAGQWVPASSGETFDNVILADTKDVIGKYPLSNSDDGARAVASTRRGVDSAFATPAPLRGDIMRRAGRLLAAHKEDIANLKTREMGKPLAETRGDVQEGIDTAYYAATEGRRMFGHTVPS